MQLALLNWFLRPANRLHAGDPLNQLLPSTRLHGEGAACTSSHRNGSSASAVHLRTFVLCDIDVCIRITCIRMWTWEMSRAEGDRVHLSLTDDLVMNSKVKYASPSRHPHMKIGERVKTYN